MLGALVQVELGWFLGVIITLGGVISSLAATLWSVVQSRLKAQDKIINNYEEVISRMQDDIDRLAKGCGSPACLWKGRE